MSETANPVVVASVGVKAVTRWLVPRSRVDSDPDVPSSQTSQKLVVLLGSVMTAIRPVGFDAIVVNAAAGAPLSRSATTTPIPFAAVTPWQNAINPGRELATSEVGTTRTKFNAVASTVPLFAC